MRAATPFALVLLTLGAPLSAQGGWVQRLPAHSPPMRAWHGLAFDAWRGVHVLFGGREYGSLYGDTWEWNGIDWLQRTPPNSPPARQGHAMTFDFSRGRIVVFSGRVFGGAIAGDTWEFDSVNWTQRFPALSPVAREGAGMAFSSARGRVILFGGLAIPNSQALQDTWEWDGTNWTPLATVHVPPARGGVMTSDFARGRVFLPGGSLPQYEAWFFDGVDWAQLPATQAPTPQFGGPLAADHARGMLVQFGGTTSSGSAGLLNETWLHDGSDWRRDARPTAINPRWACPLSFDWVRDRVVLFGGYNGGYFWDTWEYDLSGVALWWAAGVGCAGTQGVPQLRPSGPGRAIVGTSHVLEVVGGITGGALFGLGFSATNWNGNPLPLSLAGFGMPGCNLHASLDVMSFAAGVGGVAQLALTLPNDPGLVGVRFFAQALVPQPGANAFGAVMSNAVLSVVGAF